MRVEDAHGHRREGDQGKEGQHDARELDGRFRLAGHLAEAGRQRTHERSGEDEAQHHEGAQQDRERRHQPAAEPVGAIGSSFGQRARVGRDERGRQRALCEEVAQQVGDPEGGLEGVGIDARPEQRGEDRLPHDAEEAGEEDEAGDEARAAHEPPGGTPLGGRFPSLDRVREIR